MAQPSLYWLNSAASVLKWISPTAATLIGFVAWLYNLIEVGIISCLELALGKLSDLNTNFMNGGASVTGIEYIGYANAVMPLTEMLGLLSAYYTAWMIIIVFRWIKSLIPTASN